ncbi:hypothetical protein [Conexibacter sp. CPCC 206217]|uniref:hypothetical protein n=1 Tax=Conexibacter sp. CPCC 206217 TaxID=3064574 RepID=UPI0027278E48|nr:hypothetical protein [Conexibacter sp. CPCC 206217]MDO8209061.1 hypothetical protein [Conexibacter sp. CPCC 206217]
MLSSRLRSRPHRRLSSLPLLAALAPVAAFAAVAAAAQIRRGASLALPITFTPKAGRSVARRATIAVR